MFVLWVYSQGTDLSMPGERLILCLLHAMPLAMTGCDFNRTRNATHPHPLSSRAKDFSPESRDLAFAVVLRFFLLPEGASNVAHYEARRAEWWVNDSIPPHLVIPRVRGFIPTLNVRMVRPLRPGLPVTMVEERHFCAALFTSIENGL